MNHRQKQNILHSACLLAMAALFSTAPIQGAWAQTAPALGTASNFAVLGGAGVTCTGSGVAGDVGSLVSVTGFPPPDPALCTLVGTVHALDAVATTAFNDFVLAYDALKAMTCDAAHNLTGQPLGGKTLAPGVYCFDTTADLTTGTLTLDGGGDSNAVWVFQVGTGITTGTASVAMINGGQQRNVFWQVGTAATIGTDTAFKGNILAGSAITFTGVNASLVGRALAKTAVTMTGANISNGSDGGVQPPVQRAAPSLGTASNFAVLGGAGVTCTGSGVAGDVGSLVSVTGFPPPDPALCTLVGTVHALDAVATTAFNDFVLAYDALKAMTCDAAHNLTGQPLGGKTLAPGVYCFDTTADLTTGTLTLDGGGDSNAVWVFQVGTGITTGTASVAMINGGQQRNVFWQVGTAATIGTDTAFKGNILAGSAITFTGVNSSLVGRALAKTAVTMTGALISQ